MFYVIAMMAVTAIIQAIVVMSQQYGKKLIIKLLLTTGLYKLILNRRVRYGAEY